MKISQRSIEEVREAANIVEVASEFTALRRQGTRYTGLCPYPDHQEKTPSFSVTPDKGFYYCFGCQKGGDTIKLITDLKSLSFVEAVTYLAERSSIEIEFEGGTDADSRVARERNQRRRSIHKALAAAAIYYHKYLLKSRADEAQNARKYLKDRGFEDSTIEEFRLGLAPPRGSSEFLGAAGRLGIDRKALDAAGLLSPRGGERFAGRVVFPISDRRGRIVGFGGRAMGDAQPKYLNTPETEIFNKRDLLYGFPQVMEPIRKQRAALVVEGYTDVLMLYQSGIKNAVATLGTATTPGHLRVLSRYADRIYLLFDPDVAGERAIARAEDSVNLTLAANDIGASVHVVRLSRDPADWLLEHDAQEFLQLLSGSVTILEFSVYKIAEEVRDADATDRQKLLVQALERLHKIKIQAPALELEAKRQFADALQMSFQDLEVQFEEWQLRNTKSKKAQSLEETVYKSVHQKERALRQTLFADPLTQARREVLALILARPDLTKRLLRDGVESPVFSRPLYLTQEDFGEEDHSRLFAILCEYAGKDLDSIVGDERARPLMDQIGALHAEGEKLYPSAASVKEAWLRLIILNREREKRQTRDYDEKDRLHAEIQQLKQALRSVAS